MTHLTKAQTHGLFSTSVPERPNRETGNDKAYAIPFRQPEAPFAVGVDMTPDQARELRMAAYPRLEWGNVSNLSPRTRGKHY